jgi:hypothetical protein
MVNIYLGSIIPSLALFALFSRPKERWRWWVAGLGLLSIACAMGETLPLRGWLYDWFFPMRFFRHAAIFRLYFVFAVCVLALLGARDLRTGLQQVDSRGTLRFLIASLLIASCAVIAFSPFMNAVWTVGMPPKAVLLGKVHFVWVWLSLVTIAAFAWRLPRRWKEWCVPMLLVALASSDALVTAVLSMPTMLRIGQAADRWKALDQQHRSDLDLTKSALWRKESSCEPDLPSTRCRRNDQIITKTPVFNSYSTEKNVFHLAMVHDPVLKGIATGAERTWFATEAVSLSPSEPSFAAFRSRAAALGAPPLVVHLPSELLRQGQQGVRSEGHDQQLAIVARLPAAERIRADVVRYRPEELVIDVHATSDGWLLVTDRWARSWHAEVNGQPTMLYGGNFIFRAVRVLRGPNRVKFVYRPFGVPWLVTLSWGTMVLIALGAVRARAGSPMPKSSV